MYGKCLTLGGTNEDVKADGKNNMFVCFLEGFDKSSVC